MPAFVVSAKEILDNLRGLSRVRGTVSPGSVLSKRNHDNFVDLTQDSRKRLKTEGPSFSQGSNHARTSSYIDLTKSYKPVKVPARGANRTALGNISNNVSNKHSDPGGVSKPKANQSKRSREQRYQQVKAREEHRKDDQTTTIIARIASRLHATNADIDSDRDVLRQRWEVDNQLKHQEVTNDLGELNACFARAEEAILDGIAVIEERLLRRRR